MVNQRQFRLANPMRRHRLWLLIICATVAHPGICTSQVVILDTQFIASEGYDDGELQFQSITSGTEGTWLGHLGAMVDVSNGGSVTRTSEPRRNLFNKGATGGNAGGNGGGEDLGSGFTIGDQLMVTHHYSFEVDSSSSTGLLQTGVRPSYATGESAPELGLKIDYSNSDAGTLKVFSSFARSGSDEQHDSFALQVPASAVGIDNGSGGGAVDYVSDALSFTWTAEYVATDTWRTTEISVENLDTPFLARATTGNPTALEEVTISGSGNEAFFGMQPLQGFSGTGVTQAVQFLYFPSGVTPGDFDGDNDVDGSDWLRWQLNEQSFADFLIWESNYGTAIGASGAATQAVPESQSLVFCIVGLFGFTACRVRVDKVCT